MPSDGAGGRSGGDGDRGSGGSTGGGRGGGGRGGGGGRKESGFGGLGYSGGFGIGSVAGNTAAGVGGAGYGGGNMGSSNNRGGGSSTPSGLRSIADMQRGLSIAGPQLSRARDNAFATGLSHGLTALGMVTGFPGFSVASKAVSLARDYGRGYAERTSMEKAAEARGMGAPQRGDSTVSGGLAGMSRPNTQAPAKAPAKAPASSNVGSGAAGATVIMGAEKTRTGAGAGGRAKGSAVRGFGSGGLKL